MTVADCEGRGTPPAIHNNTAFCTVCRNPAPVRHSRGPRRQIGLLLVAAHDDVPPPPPPVRRRFTVERVVSSRAVIDPLTFLADGGTIKHGPRRVDYEVRDRKTGDTVFMSKRRSTAESRAGRSNQLNPTH